MKSKEITEMNKNKTKSKQRIENDRKANKKNAIFLLMVFGLVSLFGDIIYEGARSINGPYLSVLGANAVIIGFVIGASELFGYLLRMLAGYFADKTKHYWLFVFLGYGLLISIPLLSLSSLWQIAAILIILERVGKGLRSPARDTIVSYAAKQIGTGIGFGFSEVLDQIGAALGPIIIAISFLSTKEVVTNISSYQKAYSLLFIPFLALLILLILAYIKVKSPEKLEEKKAKGFRINHSSILSSYMLFSFFTTLGFVNFALIGYHIKYNAIASDAYIPMLYAFAMIVDGIFALVLGAAYDRIKRDLEIKGERKRKEFYLLLSLPIATTISLFFAFSSEFWIIVIGVFFWGFVMGTHETLMKAVIADITTKQKRATSYGAFNTIYGIALFLGSSLAGILYEMNISYLISVMLSFQIISIFLFEFMVKKAIK